MRYIHVKVFAGMNKESFSLVKNKQNTGEYFLAHVKEKAERNQANNRVIELVAKHFQIPASLVRIINGHRHPSKLLVVEDWEN